MPNWLDAPLWYERAASITPLEQAHALRKTAAWVANPTTPTCFGRGAQDKEGKRCGALESRAHAFCAIGFYARQVGEIDEHRAIARTGMRPEVVFGTWDYMGGLLRATNYWEFKQARDWLVSMLLERAQELEELIPEAPELAQERERVLA